MGAIKYLLALLLILIPATSLAASTWNSPSCKRNDVNAIIQAATTVTGDTVTIPTCEGTDGTWTSGISLSSNKLLTLQGAGATNTVISHGNITAITMIGAHRITGIGFNQTVGGGFTIHARQKGWRIDHCSFTNSVGSSQYTIQATGANETVLPAGLIDNNDFIQGRVVIDGMGTFLKNSGFWAADPLIGTADQVYIEDNTFYKTVGGGGNVIDTNYASSYVARYNTVTGTTEFMAHGWSDELHRGARSWEIYGNTFTASTNSWAVAIWPRSGTGIIAFNTFAGDYDYDIIFDDRRAIQSCEDCDTVGYCDGSSYVDGNIEANGWPCRDQIGRGKDASVWTANTVNPAPVQASSPAYLFANRRGETASSVHVHNNAGAWIQADRDYYEPPTGSFDGTTGTGCGTLASRPVTCTTGVAYWATNQSCTDMTGMVGKVDPEGDRPDVSYKITGSLYKCVGNAWEETASYTPYEYPHPLRDDAGTDETAPTLVSATIAANGTSLYLVFSESVTVNTNTGFVLTATGSPTLTYASGAGTTTLVYTISAAVQQSESGITLAYTTGANYIEDAAGNDLGSFTGTAVVNHSTQNTPPTVELTVTKTGSGCTVTSAPSGVNCGSTCTLSVDNGTAVTLSGWSENGWNAITYGGDCAANGTVTMNADKECTATCTQVQLFP